MLWILSVLPLSLVSQGVELTGMPVFYTPHWHRILLLFFSTGSQPHWDLSQFYLNFSLHQQIAKLTAGRCWWIMWSCSDKNWFIEDRFRARPIENGMQEGRIHKGFCPNLMQAQKRPGTRRSQERKLRFGKHAWLAVWRVRSRQPAVSYNSRFSDCWESDASVSW